MMKHLIKEAQIMMKTFLVSNDIHHRAVLGTKKIMAVLGISIYIYANTFHIVNNLSCFLYLVVGKNHNAILGKHF